MSGSTKYIPPTSTGRIGLRHGQADINHRYQPKHRDVATPYFQHQQSWINEILVDITFAASRRGTPHDTSTGGQWAACSTKIDLTREIRYRQCARAIELATANSADTLCEKRRCVRKDIVAGRFNGKAKRELHGSHKKWNIGKLSYRRTRAQSLTDVAITAEQRLEVVFEEASDLSQDIRTIRSHGALKSQGMVNMWRNRCCRQESSATSGWLPWPSVERCGQLGLPRSRYAFWPPSLGSCGGWQYVPHVRGKDGQLSYWRSCARVAGEVRKAYDSVAGRKVMIEVTGESQTSAENLRFLILIRLKCYFLRFLRHLFVQLASLSDMSSI